MAWKWDCMTGLFCTLQFLITFLDLVRMARPQTRLQLFPCSSSRIVATHWPRRKTLRKSRNRVVTWYDTEKDDRSIEVLVQMIYYFQNSFLKYSVITDRTLKKWTNLFVVGEKIYQSWHHTRWLLLIADFCVGHGGRCFWVLLFVGCKWIHFFKVSVSVYGFWREVKNHPTFKALAAFTTVLSSCSIRTEG